MKRNIGNKQLKTITQGHAGNWTHRSGDLEKRRDQKMNPKLQTTGEKGEH